MHIETGCFDLEPFVIFILKYQKETRSFIIIHTCTSMLSTQLNTTIVNSTKKMYVFDNNAMLSFKNRG